LVEKLRLWLIGEPTSREFRLACQHAPQDIAMSRLTNLGEAVDRLAQATRPPELVVLAQSRPGQFRSLELERLYALAPLLRVFVVAGSWCEGETRSGQPPAGAIRLYWHQWEARLSAEMDRYRRGRCPLWGAPVTATDGERLLEDEQLFSPARQDVGARSGLVAVYSHDYEMFDWLSAACRRLDLPSVWLRHGEVFRGRGVTAAIWDAGAFDAPEREQLRRAGHRLQVPLLALLSFPRHETFRHAMAAGATAAMAKPLEVVALWWQLRRLAGPAPAMVSASP